MKHSIEEGNSKVMLEFVNRKFDLSIKRHLEDGSDDIQQMDLTDRELSAVYLLIETFERRGFEVL